MAPMKVVFVPGNGTHLDSIAVARSHVAKLAAARRRQLRLASAASEQGPTTRQEFTPTFWHNNIRRQQIPRTGPPPRECDIHQLPNGDEKDDNVSCEVLPQLQLTILQKGNSDPFDSHSCIRIDPPANDLLSFSRDYFLPLIDSFERSSYKQASYENKFYETTSDAMTDECTAASTLARFAMVLSNLRPSNTHYRLVASKYAAQAYASLRLSLACGQTIHEARVQRNRQVFALLATETFGRNFQAAAVHMQSLQNLLLQDQAQGLILSHKLLQACSYIDLYRSTLSATRPVFNPHRFTCFDPDPLTHIAVQLAQLGLISPSAYSESPDIPHRLRPHFARMRWLCIISGAFSRAIGLVTLAVTNSWAEHGHRAMFAISSAYFDAADALRSTGAAAATAATSPADTADLRLQAITALAALFCLFADNNFDYLPPTNDTLWKIMYPTLSWARRVLPELQDRISLLEHQIGSSLKLWLLYVTSLAEQAENMFLSISLEHLNEWHVRFVQQAVDMGLSRFEDVEAELKRFLYHPRTRMDGKMWFERCLRSLTSSGIS